MTTTKKCWGCSRKVKVPAKKTGFFDQAYVSMPCHCKIVTICVKCAKSDRDEAIRLASSVINDVSHTKICSK